jgi:branched-chain amino acid transport system ATP-binding protein
MNPDHPAKDAVLSCHEITKDFGGLRAVDSFSMTVHFGTIHALIGPNGSGKTTFFNVISGILPATSGMVRFMGEDITRSMPHMITAKGIARTFQRAYLISTLTCIENIMVGAYCRGKTDLWGTFFRPPFRISKQERELRREAYELLDFVGLSSEANRLPGDLVWIQTQLLQIARALATAPRLLLLDEPTAGMGSEETAEVEEVIREVRRSGITIVLVSHDVKSVRRLSDCATAINFGKKLSEGTCTEVLSDPQVVEAYLGV